MTRKCPRVLTVLSTLITILLLWTVHTEPHAYRYPNVKAYDLSDVLTKEKWTDNDYRFLALQTGLFPPALDLLREQGKLSKVPAVQKAYLTPAEIRCSPNALIARSERLVNTRSNPVALEDGDILVTNGTHLLGWRSGHAGIVVDAENGTLLEAVVIGENSSFQPVSRWSHFSTFAVYRLAGADSKTRTAIAKTAARRLNNIPYHPMVGISQPKRMAGKVSGTQCSHLVWEAFAAYGYDLDENGGPIVTPADLANSPLLELKQVYGIPFHFVD